MDAALPTAAHFVDSILASLDNGPEGGFDVYSSPLLDTGDDEIFPRSIGALSCLGRPPLPEVGPIPSTPSPLSWHRTSSFATCK